MNKEAYAAVVMLWRVLYGLSVSSRREHCRNLGGRDTTTTTVECVYRAYSCWGDTPSLRMTDSAASVGALPVRHLGGGNAKPRKRDTENLQQASHGRRVNDQDCARDRSVGEGLYRVTH